MECPFLTSLCWLIKVANALFISAGSGDTNIESPGVIKIKLPRGAAVWIARIASAGCISVALGCFMLMVRLFVGMVYAGHYGQRCI